MRRVERMMLALTVAVAVAAAASCKKPDDAKPDEKGGDKTPSTAVGQTPAPTPPAPGAGPSLARSGKVSALAGKVLPAGLDWVGGVNVTPLFESALYFQFEPWVDWALKQDEVAALLAVAEVSPKQFDQAVAGGTFMPPTGVGVLTGSFNAKALVDLAKGKSGLELATRNTADVTWYAVDGKGTGFGVSGDGTISAGTEKLLESSLALQRGDGKAESELDSIQKAIDTQATFWFAAKVPKAARAALEAEINRLQVPLMRGLRELVGTTHAGVSIDLSRSIVIQGAATLGSPEAAKAVAAQLGYALGSFELLTSLAFDRFDATASGNAVQITVQLNRQLWERLLFWAAVGGQFASLGTAAEPDFMDRSATDVMATKPFADRPKDRKKSAATQKLPDDVPAKARALNAPAVQKPTPPAPAPAPR